MNNTMRGFLVLGLLSTVCVVGGVNGHGIMSSHNSPARVLARSRCFSSLLAFFMLNLFVVFYGFVDFCFRVFPIVLGWLVWYTGDWGGLNLPRGGLR